MNELSSVTTKYALLDKNPYFRTHLGKIVSKATFPTQFAGLYNIKYSPDGHILISSFGQGTIQVRNGRTAEVIRTVRSGGHTSFPVMCSKFHPNNHDYFFSSTSDGKIFKCSSSNTAYDIYAEERGNEISSFDIGSDGVNLVTGGKDFKIRVYDANKSVLKHVYARGGVVVDSTELQRFHRMRIFCIKFYPPNPDVFLSGGWDDSVKIWDLRDKNGCIRSCFGPHICGEAIDIRDKNILTGSWVVRQSLQLWDYGSGRLIETIVPQNRSTGITGEYLYACQFLNGDPRDDLVAIGGSGTGHVEVISIRDKLVVGFYPVNKACHTLDTCQKQIAFGGMDPEINIADLSLF